MSRSRIRLISFWASLKKDLEHTEGLIQQGSWLLSLEDTGGRGTSSGLCVACGRGRGGIKHLPWGWDCGAIEEELRTQKVLDFGLEQMWGMGERGNKRWRLADL